MSDQEERLGPLRTGARVEVRADDAVLRGPAFDGFRAVNRTCLGHASDDGFGERREAVRIQLIEVESVRLPVFVEAKAKIEARLALQPCDVRQGFRSLGRAVLAVEIDALCDSPGGSKQSPSGSSKGRAKYPNPAARHFPAEAGAPPAAQPAHHRGCRWRCRCAGRGCVSACCSDGLRPRMSFGAGWISSMVQPCA